jgi:hypothetical protein
MIDLKSFGIVTNILDDWHTNAQPTSPARSWALSMKYSEPKEKGAPVNPGRLKWLKMNCRIGPSLRRDRHAGFTGFRCS